MQIYIQTYFIDKLFFFNIYLFEHEQIIFGDSFFLCHQWQGQEWENTALAKSRQQTVSLSNLTDQEKVNGEDSFLTLEMVALVAYL